MTQSHAAAVLHRIATSFFTASLSLVAACLTMPLHAATISPFEVDTRYRSFQEFDTTDTQFGVFGGVTINSHGEIAFRTNTVNPTNSALDDRSAIFTEAAGPIPILLALAGDQAPDAPSGLLYNRFQTPIITDAGVTGFIAAIADPNAPPDPDPEAPGNENLNSFFSTSPTARDQTRAALYPGQTLTVTPDNAQATLSLAFDKRVVLGNDGNFAAFTNISSGPPSPGTPAAIIAGLAPDADRLVARVGDPSPAGGTYVAFADVAANGLGQTLFTGNVLNSSFSPNSLFSEAAGSIGAPAVIASQGDPVPAIGPNAVLASQRDFR